MIPHREWFCEYEIYDGGDVFLGDEPITKIIGWGKVKLKLMDGRIRTLIGVQHIRRLAINLFYVRKMDDAGLKILFEKETSRMVRWEMVLLKGFLFGTLYKMQERNISDRCNNYVVPKIGVEE